MRKYNLHHEEPAVRCRAEQKNINEQSKQEITDRKKTEELQEIEERHRILVERTNDGIAIIQDRLIKYVNPRLAEISGYTVEELIGSPFAIYIHPDELPKVVNRYLRRMAGKEVLSKYESVVKHKEGRNIFVEFNASIITYHGKPADLVIVRDITKRKLVEEEKERLQKQLIQSEKMAGIGTLTSGIAHEFNNLLQIMRGHTEFAQRTKKAKDVEEALDIVINTSDRVSKIIRDLLAFSKKEAAEKKLCDITEPIESVLSMTEEQLKKNNIEVVRKYGRVPKIEVDKGEMQQVFLNMVTNARDSMLPKGGKLEIEVNQVKENVEVRFTDTGKGIKREDLGKVFEPFYTTKGSVGGNSGIQGIGLGLSVSCGIVERQGGMIEVESEAGKGTTFIVRLPGKGEEVKNRRARVEEKKKRREPEPLKILVVDDEEEICKMLTKWLSAEGHKVKYALTGKQALNLFKKEYFDIVFLNIVMPGIAAIDVHEEIKEISPKTKVIMITGKLVDKDTWKELKEKGASGYIQKPFKIEDINNCLASIEN